MILMLYTLLCAEGYGKYKFVYTGRARVLLLVFQSTWLRFCWNCRCCHRRRHRRHHCYWWECIDCVFGCIYLTFIFAVVRWSFEMDDFRSVISYLLRHSIYNHTLAFDCVRWKYGKNGFLICLIPCFGSKSFIKKITKNEDCASENRLQK